MFPSHDRLELQYVLDQNGGEFLIGNAFRDAVIPGVGCLFAGVGSDPRRERIRLRYWPWTEVWWDPFSSPWWEAESCRYVFRQRWVDLDDLKAMFPEKEKDIEDHYGELTGSFEYVAAIYFSKDTLL